MEFRILGPLEALREGIPLPLGGPKQRALLALLLLHANEPLSADRLIDGLWNEHPPRTASKSLHVHVSTLRKQLPGGALVTRPSGYELQLGLDELDLTCFERLVAEARGAVPDVAAEKLREALSLWRGPPLSDFRYEPWAQAEITRLEEARLAAFEERIDAELALGRHAHVVGELESAVARHPLRERLSSQQMLALYRSRRQADALAAYQNARHALVEELGIEPSRELRELHQAILRQDPELDLGSSDEPVPETPASAFVGRESELAELFAGLDDAFAGRGRLFLLSGEPGIGKSRLSEEVAARARARGARVLVGRCWEAGGAPAYWPWVQSLRAYVRESDAAALRSELGPGAATLAQILPELRQHLADLPEPPSLEAEGARFRLFDATTEFLRNASARRPILLVLDDLHAADSPSLLLLRFLARELGSTRLLLVGAFRDFDPLPTQPLAEMLAELAREPVTRRLSLRGLRQEDVADYVEQTASDLASRELAGTLYRETEGNPLFVGEMVRLLAVEGVSPELTSEVRLAIPQTVRDVIARRLTHLSDECSRVLVLASVLGREFALDALAPVSGISENELVDLLDEALAARVVSDVPGGIGRLRFAHVLIRDTLYDGLAAARRVRLHRQVVEALEALYGGERGPHLAELAHHAFAGGKIDKGLRYAQRAGDHALAQLAYEEAARLYETALGALEPSVAAEDTRCELLLSLGAAEARAGDTPAANKAFLDAAGIARRLDLPRELARAAVGYGGRIVFARAGDDDRLVPLLEEGLAALEDDQVELRVRLLARLAGALRDEHSHDRREALSEEAVELARRNGDPGVLAYALDGRLVAIVSPDTVAQLLALGSELLDVAQRSGNMELAGFAHSHRLIAQLLVGDLRGAEADLELSSRIAQELRQPAHLWRVRGEQAMLALAAGRLHEADELVAQALALGERAQRNEAIPVYWLQRSTLCEFRGRLEEVEPAIRDLVIEYPARPVFRCTLAHLYARIGRLTEAKRAFAELAENNFSALPFDQEWLFGMSLLAETCSLLADSDAAEVLYRLLLPYAAFNVVDVTEGFTGSASRYLGLLAATMSRWDQAAEHFEDALALNARMGVRPWLAHTQADYARMLLARDGPGDRARARELHDAALATYSELGMDGFSV